MYWIVVGMVWFHLIMWKAFRRLLSIIWRLNLSEAYVNIGNTSEVTRMIFYLLWSSFQIFAIFVIAVLHLWISLSLLPFDHGTKRKKNGWLLQSCLGYVHWIWYSVYYQLSYFLFLAGWFKDHLCFKAFQLVPPVIFHCEKNVISWLKIGNVNDH